MDNTTKKSTKAYPEDRLVSLPDLDQEVLKWWKENDIFKKSIEMREGSPQFVFFEGPPSANGMPGIHHVIARTIKDMYCRYKTLKGFQVKRKAGWDTHGLPVELKVEKELGISKIDIGKKISIEEYNKACREAVMRFKDEWNQLTEEMGYWVDLEHPYITFSNDYIESCWALLKQLHSKDLLYKGYSIQPYSPAAGTGLSSHELNQPGCYRDVTDNTVTAQFKAIRNAASEALFAAAAHQVYFLAWTTTPWTLPSNTALGVGKGIRYALVDTENPYTGEAASVVMAMDLVTQIMGVKGKFDAAVGAEGKGKIGGKELPFKIVAQFKGSDLAGINYEQLLPYVAPQGDAFRVVIGDFITTSDGTGIVHLAPTFGADDFRVAKQNGISAVQVSLEDGSLGPLVDKEGKFVQEIQDERFGFGGEAVKREYLNEEEIQAAYELQNEQLKDIIPNLKGYLSVDERIALKLKLESLAFKIEKYEHSYPHCWRTDKPVLYYPLDNWFIRTTAVKDRMVELNKTINWKPAATGEGRFGNWLENMVDWNLSRSRYWGTPLPVWRTEDGSQEKCIGSIAELRSEAEKAVAAGLMDKATWTRFEEADDLHRPYVDELVLVSDDGQPMNRETDLIDVWFDSGAMPYAQWHYPLENEDIFKASFPADFIAEGVDQTRGWFYTLHALGVMLHDSVAYKNVVSNGFVLDEKGRKMSKSLGNVISPAEILPVYGADAARWYMVGNAAPWENLKFGKKFLEESKRVFFGTLFNTYFFFAQYANIDGFDYSGTRIPMQDRSELDRWIISRLNQLIKEVDGFMGDYEPHRAIKAMESFLDQLSNWYVRLSRRVFWKSEMGQEKEAAFQTLYECLLTISKLMSPVAPFYSEKLYRDLNEVCGLDHAESVHLSDFPKVKAAEIDEALEYRMELAQAATSLVHSIRKNERIKVRQPLQKVLIPVLNEEMRTSLREMEQVILREVNAKEMELVSADEDTTIVKKAKPNFKALGPKLGKNVKAAAGVIGAFTNHEIGILEAAGEIEVEIAGAPITLTLSEVEIRTEDVPGWKVASNATLTVALDVTITDTLKREGLARDMVNRIQNLRKDLDFDVMDRIHIEIEADESWHAAIQAHSDFICKETLGLDLKTVENLSAGQTIDIDGVEGKIHIYR